MNHISRILAAASRHCSKDASRPHLASVRLSWSAGAFVAIATDGHTMIAASSKCDGEPFEALYDGKAIAKGAKLAKAKDGYCIREEGNVLAFSDGAGSVLRVEPRETALKFPAVVQVIPPVTDESGSFQTFNARYIAEHAETHLALANEKTGAVGFLPAKDRLSPAMMVSESVDGFRTLSIIMPMRGFEKVEEPDAIRQWLRERAGAPVASIVVEAAE